FKVDFMPYLPFAKRVRMTVSRAPQPSLLRGPKTRSAMRCRCLVICLVMLFLLNNASEFVAAPQHAKARH
ncbi:hypothetical protein, partial [Mesorhizobium sp. M2A.F.Ca.ET.067.02.1.1]|uniref:hypothetical protein n=1 Tax=Mesorhizobium sp. M2A.F.Ca.ET.067.02.1.1 TaxID=2496749 RepID=UPI001AEC9885